jgi:polyisoprenoid-binding protein YceI
MNKLIFSIFLILIAGTASAQDKYFTKTGKINFNATAPSSPEKIDALNKSSICVLDIKTGNIQFSLLMKGFEFERALMQEHFNENYVESNKFPKAEFKGLIINNAAVNYAKDGVYPVKVNGKLTMHGETKDVETNGMLTIKAGKISAIAEFVITLSDYKVSIPQLVADKVSKTARISVDCLLESLTK